MSKEIKLNNTLLSVDNEGIATLTINRASKLNALNYETLEDIRQNMQEVYDNPSIKSVIITGSGSKAFVAGADIAELAHLDRVNAKRYSQNGQDIFAMIENCPKPVIAAVNGYALGGGCELALACHIRIAVDTAKFGLPEVTLGTIPGFGGTQRLSQIIGKAKALELIMTGDRLSAQEAKELGLVNHLLNTKEEILDKSKEILRKIMKGSPAAIALVIKSVNSIYDSQEKGYLIESSFFGKAAETEDYKEGMTAFLEKRKAEFKGK